MLDDDTVAAHSVRAARSVARAVVLVVPADYDGDGEGADVVVVGGDHARAVGARRARALRRRRHRRRARRRSTARDSPRSSRPWSTRSRRRRRRDSGTRDHRHRQARRVAKATRPSSASTVAREELVDRADAPGLSSRRLVRAHASGDDATDDAALVEAHRRTGRGRARRTRQHQDHRARATSRRLVASGGARMRIGHGIDVHRVSDDPARASGSVSFTIPGCAGPRGPLRRRRRDARAV